MKEKRDYRFRREEIIGRTRSCGRVQSISTFGVGLNARIYHGGFAGEMLVPEKYLEESIGVCGTARATKNRVNRPPSEWEKIFANSASEKVLVCKICEKPKQIKKQPAPPNN
ncbi:hypothetical protein AAY473_037128 [Plecturocebus cupreus]